MQHTSNHPVVTQTDEFANDGASIGAVAVQNESAKYSAESVGNTSAGREVLDNDLIPYEAAAALIGIEPKRLLGYLYRNKLGDPIGGATTDGIMVYDWSLAELRKRLADRDAVAP